jgi:glycogen synthase
VKVLVISNLYPPDIIGGYELACLHVVDALRDRGHDVRVLTTVPRQPLPSEPHVLRTLHLADVYNMYLLEHGRRSPVSQYKIGVAARLVQAHNVHVMIAALEEFRPDVAYVCNLIGLGGLGLIGCLQYLKVPWVWQLGDRVPPSLCTRWDQVDPVLAREFSRLIHGHYIVVSTHLLEEIESQGVSLNGQIEIVPNWVAGPRPASRTTFYDGGQLRIISAGQIAMHKGVQLLIESAARLRDWGQDNFLVDVYGKVTDAYFPSLIKKYGLDRHVTLKGALPQSELMARFIDYDLFAFPTWEREPFGLVPLEAGAAGCVPVITQNCGVGEWLVNDVHCLKVPRSAQAFARVWRQVIDGEIDIEPIARRIAATALRDFHLDAIIPRIESALHQASLQSRAGAGTSAEAYRLALLAEHLSHVLIEDSLCA